MQVDRMNLSEDLAPNAKLDVTPGNDFICPQHLGYTYEVGELSTHFKRHRK